VPTDKSERLSKHYRKSILQESERGKAKQFKRKRSNSSGGSSFMTVSDRAASFLRKDLVGEIRGSIANRVDMSLPEI